MNWPVHLLANALMAYAAAWLLTGRAPRSFGEVAPYFWPMAASNLIDLDHLLADPIYDPARCSIGFHPLHTVPAGVVYAAMLIWSRTRWFAVGAITHLALDALDCVI